MLANKISLVKKNKFRIGKYIEGGGYVSNQPVLDIGNLRTYFYLNENQVAKAVDGVSFSVYPGETVALVAGSGDADVPACRTDRSRFLDMVITHRFRIAADRIARVQAHGVLQGRHHHRIDIVAPRQESDRPSATIRQFDALLP